MKSIVVLVLVSFVAVLYGQGQVEHGQLCNGLLLQCNRFNNTVGCMSRTANSTIGQDTCQTGAGVDLGRCQCLRDCRGDGIFHHVAEFVPSKGVCGGHVGQLCTSLEPHCIEFAICNFLTSRCLCESGYVSVEEGKRCQLA